MVEFDPFDAPRSIRITREEAMSSHVDDLLQRQHSLRGERTTRHGRGGHWYYQNWFVFMLVGGLAAFAAWALIEPIFNDLEYLQGSLEQVGVAENAGQIPLGDGQAMEVRIPLSGSVVVDGQPVWLLSDTRMISPDGSMATLDPADLQLGKEVGVYVEYEPVGAEGVAIAHLVKLDPPPQSNAQRSQTLRQQHYRSAAAGFLLFAIVGGCVGLTLGATDGVVCRLPRRALLGGIIGLLVGFIGGLLSGILANLAYAPLNQLAMNQASGVNDLTLFGFVIQMIGRSLGWMLAGMTMGLGQGIALRSTRLLLYGFLGGIVGGLIGGLLFDPIDLILLGGVKPSSHWSRLVGIVAVGASVGLMIGLVELLARDAWLRMLEGPLAGKEFLIFKDRVQLGSSHRAEIYLFNDPQVAGIHATIRAMGEQCEIENLSAEYPTEVNGRRFHRTRLRHGDRITLGKTVLLFQQRKSS